MDNDNCKKPVARIIPRPLNNAVIRACMERGLHPLVTRVLAGRVTPDDDLDAILNPSLSRLNSPDTLPDIDKAVSEIVEAIVNKRIFALEVDHDSDGVQAHCILWLSLIQYFGHPADRVQTYIGHRLRDGYGLSSNVAQRILAANPRPDLILTADNGSSDEERIALLSKNQIKTVVTDHHLIPVDGVPKSALACVSPARTDSRYPDAKICGAMVAWLLMCAVRKRLIDIQYLPATAPNLAGLLDMVAAATVSDCVDLKSPNNRSVVVAGLKQMSACIRPCWQAIRPALKAENRSFTARDCGWGLGPRINACGRLNEAMPGVRFLLADTLTKAAEQVAVMETENTRRREIERSLLQEAETLAMDAIRAGWRGLVINFSQGHPGVHGIVAGRIAQAWGRPTVCLSPKVGEPDLVSGSCRSAGGVDMRAALQAVADTDWGILKAFGGHRAAAGLTVHRSRVQDFIREFDRAVVAQVGSRPLAPVIETDGELVSEDFTVETIQALSTLEPYGRGFESPVFAQVFEIADTKPVGNGAHLKLYLKTTDGFGVRGIWFNAIGEDGVSPVHVGQRHRLVYELSINEWNGNRSVQIQVRSVEITAQARKTQSLPKAVDWF